MLRLNEEFHNPAKHLLLKKKKLMGAWLQMASPFAAEIFAKAGVDVLMIDMEHGPNDILSLIDQLRALGRFDSVPIVRTPWNDMVAVKRILDAGAYGVLIPYVNTPGGGPERRCRLQIPSPRRSGRGSQPKGPRMEHEQHELFSARQRRNPCYDGGGDPGGRGPY